MSARNAAWVPPTAAGAIAVAGGAVVILPQHAVSVLRVLLVTVAVLVLVAAVLDRLAPLDHDGTGFGRSSPFEATTRRRRHRRDQPSSLSRVHGELAPGMVRADIDPLTPLLARRLAAIADTTLAREGLDPDGPDGAAAEARLSLRAWTAIRAPRSGRPRRGEPAVRRRMASAEQIATTVHAVLDEIDRPPTRGRP